MQKKGKKRGQVNKSNTAVKPGKIFLFKLMLYPQPCSTYTINNYLFNCILIFQECNTVYSFKIGYLNFSCPLFLSCDINVNIQYCDVACEFL